MGIETTGDRARVAGSDSTIPPGTPGSERRIRRSRLAAIRDTVGAVAGAVLGLVPHVLHHIGLIAGAALVTGATGNALFFVRVGVLHPAAAPPAPAIPDVARTGDRGRCLRRPVLPVGLRHWSRHQRRQSL